MKFFIRNSFVSFRCKEFVEKEIRCERIYFRRGKLRKGIFYAERTQDPYVIVVPVTLVKDIKDNSPYGKIASMKEGRYFMGKIEIEPNGKVYVRNDIAYMSFSEV